VLENGALPLDLLEELVDLYIARTRGQGFSYLAPI
jgi:hypothetical protein